MAHYYIYKVTQAPGSMVKNLQKIDRFEKYKQARQAVKALRMENPEEKPDLFKIIFAESELSAEEQLMEKREAPIIEEWEK